MDQKKRLRELHCFRTLSEEVIEELSQAGRVSVYSKNTTIIRAREKVREIYFAISGKVIIYNLTRHGQRKIIFVLGSGVLINENVIKYAYSTLIF
ncbi:MAG: cyclic nucleotide-binding domain-containing protein [Eubacteriales bacterium]|nr:cyclic nucleotide-binding domain-containing protein [Eubacteriales bacterium]